MTNGNIQPESLSGQTSQNLGMVVSGSLTEGMEVRLDASTSIEDIKVGTFVNIQGQKMRFFGVVTEVALNAMDQTMSASPPDVSNPFIAKVISGTAAYGTITVEPMLTIGGKDNIAGVDGPQPAKTVPPHFSTVGTATDDDIRIVFGEEDENHFYIGNPLDMETRLCLNIEELVKRSNGVFGKSGTGKTFLTRLLLLGILQNGTASNLVFDMHGEYGWKGTSESDNREVKGLKQLFPSKVAVFSLDEESSRRRGLSPDYVVRIGYEEIDPEDVQMLRDTLNLSEVAADTAYALQRKFGNRKWLKSFLDMPTGSEVGELAVELNVNEGALSTLHRRLVRFERFQFMDDSAGHDSVNQILNYIERGMHVVLEFGRYGSDLAAYILVANLLTRRIYDRYQTLTEKAMGDQSERPRPLVITVEEAHKFLSPAIADQTIFGTIAR
ncbi:MAG: ATP-binding protein, partial [SAR202 cluster bacterium]|nr:ATP-binding protein [SAR202 cluster bacterium]